MNTGPQSLTIDMGVQQSVQRVVMDSTGSNNDDARAYKVEHSTDKATWYLAMTGTETGPVVTADFTDSTARYIRVTQTSIYDVNAYGRDPNGASSSLRSYRSGEVSSSTNVKSRTYPSTVCVPKEPKTSGAKARYFYDGFVNKDTSDMSAECALANPFGTAGPRTATIALTEAKAAGGSWCHYNARYAFYDDDYAPGISTLVAGVAGPFRWDFPDANDYGDYVRFGFECSLTPVPPFACCVSRRSSPSGPGPTCSDLYVRRIPDNSSAWHHL
jgi:hypothetical protein